MLIPADITLLRSEVVQGGRFSHVRCTFSVTDLRNGYTRMMVTNARTPEAALDNIRWRLSEDYARAYGKIDWPVDA